MKSLILVAGALAALHAPAFAGSKKKPIAKPVAPTQVVASDIPRDGAQLDIPALPADTSSLFETMAVAKPVAMKSTKDKPAVIKTGTDYALGRRQSVAKPDREVEEIIPKSLNQAQVATVVQSRMSDIQNCWDLVPKAHRADACTAQLRLSISDAGVVTNAQLGGDVPAGAQQCITSAAMKWTFPVAETRTEIEYGISLRSL
jgi:hypothetical protein